MRTTRRSGLLTRPAFEKRTQALLTPQALQGNQCVIYVDIDRLHVLNENLGMHVGDDVIVRVAEVIRRQLAPRMLAARISGDRFALFVGDSNLDKAQTVAENLRDAIGNIEFVAGNEPVDISASCGVARVSDSKHPLSHALAAAEIACKAAKDRGRDRVELYEESDQSIVRRYTDVTLVGTLRYALAQNNFRLEAQCIVPLHASGPSAKYELLLRMTDEEGVCVSPDKFLSAAERYQLAPAIDRWVVTNVLATLTPHVAMLTAKKASFAVNISGQSLGDQEFSTFLETRLRESRLPPQLLSFELTETAAVANIVRAEALMRRLRDLGLRRRPRRLRPWPELADLPEDAARDLSQDRRQLRSRRRRRRPVAGDAERHRATRPRHGAADRRRMRRERADPRNHPRTRCRIRPGILHRPSGAAHGRDQRAHSGLNS